jgi:predicted lactoylglutathione lyase
MKKMIFVNLPVEDLDRSKDFFATLGYTYNPQFTDENAACMVISEEFFVMLLRRDFFKNFIKKEIADASKVTESIVSLTMENRAEVDVMLAKALAVGASETLSMDEGWMYQRGFADLDGHLWEYFYMDMNAIPPAAMSGGTNGK